MLFIILFHLQVIALIAAILGKTGTKEDAMPSFLRSKVPVIQIMT